MLRLANMSTQEKQQVEKSADFVLSFLEQDKKKTRMELKKQQEVKKKEL